MDEPMPSEEPSEPIGSSDEDMSFDEPADSQAPKDDKPFSDEPFDAGVEADEETDPKKFIQQLTGKLGQSLRKYTEEQGQPDFELEKFAINSLLSATHTAEMDNEDQKDIINKVKKSGIKDTEEKESEEIASNEEPMDTEAPEEKPSDDENLNFGGEEEIEENMFIDNPKKLSIFAPEGSEESQYQKRHNVTEKESNNYMFWQNLKTIHHAAGELLKMNYDEVDALLSDGHGWALDHMATSADDVEEVYHFIEGRLNDYHVDSHDEYNMEDEWSVPMELHTEAPISDDLKYHLENNIPLNETIYRIGSEKYFNLIKEVKALYNKGLIKLNENDTFIVNEFDNQYIMLEGKKIKMNFIYEEVETEDINEAEYKGKKVQLGKPKRGGSKKFYVYVKDPKSGNVKKVSFGAKAGGGNLAVKLRDPKARKAFSDRHNCPSKTDRTTPGYWACRLPRFSKQLNLSGGGTWW
jgi:hypothetical protein